MKILVSVILAVYNGEKYLSQAIESILAQTYFPIEIIIINDGSHDATEQIANKYPVRYLFQSNQGQPSALNQGIRLSQGSYIAFLDVDDLYVPDKIALQVDLLNEMPNVDMVFGRVEHFFSPECPLEMRERIRIPSQIMPVRFASVGLFRKECFEKVGLFKEEQRIGAFIEWYMRAVDIGLKEDCVPRSVLQRRFHEDNMSRHSLHTGFEYIQLVKAALDRRRSMEEGTHVSG